MAANAILKKRDMYHMYHTSADLVSAAVDGGTVCVRDMALDWRFNAPPRCAAANSGLAFCCLFCAMAQPHHQPLLPPQRRTLTWLPCCAACTTAFQRTAAHSSPSA